MGSVIHKPISDHLRMVRETTFKLAHKRADFLDVVAQLTILAQQLHESRFTGNLQINWSEGSITNTTLTHMKSLPDPGDF